MDDDGLLRLYLSRDGGFSWQEIQQGHWSFQMIAQGSILVLVPKRPTVDPVDYVMYVASVYVCVNERESERKRVCVCERDSPSLSLSLLHSRWSCDEGTTWTRYTFSPEPMRLIGLLPERGERARRLTYVFQTFIISFTTTFISPSRLFGYFRGRSPFAWLIVELDFSTSVPTQCTYPDDYFEWIPSDEVSHTHHFLYISYLCTPLPDRITQ